MQILPRKLVFKTFPRACEGNISCALCTERDQFSNNTVEMLPMIPMLNTVKSVSVSQKDFYSIFLKTKEHSSLRYREGQL